MAKMVTVSKAEHEMLIAAYAQDGILIAKLEEELKQAKEDIKRLLIINPTGGACDFCKCDPVMCNGCESQAEWRGWSDADK